jgi:uncharacterized membrane protein
VFPGGKVTDDKWKVVALMIVAVLALSMGETLLAKGMKQTATIEGGAWIHVRGILTNGYFWGGAVLMALHFMMYMLALRWADLSFVLPLTALSYLCGGLLAKYYLGEAVTPVRWMGIFIITVGVALVGVGDTGPARSQPEIKQSSQEPVVSSQ